MKLEGINPNTAEYTADTDDVWNDSVVALSTRNGQLDDIRARRKPGTDDLFQRLGAPHRDISDLYAFPFFAISIAIAVQR